MIVSRTERPRLDLAGVAILAALIVLLHIATNLLTVYEFHRDELLYLAMGKHLRLWRMDFPPGIALIANGSRALFGDSLTAIRAFPALTHGATALLATLIARELGGGAVAQRVSVLAIALSPLFLRSGGMLQPVVFDQFWWTLALYFLIRLCSTDDGRWWIALGAALGLGLLTKFSIGFIGLPIVVATVLTPQRRWLATRWPWLALLVALAIGAPAIVGQVALGFPVLGQMDTLQGSQLARMTYTMFLGEQLLCGPAIVLAVAGVIALLFLKRWQAYRVVALSCVGAFLLLLLLHGKSYYIGPIYPTLYAAGATTLELGKMGAMRTSRIALATIVLLAFGALILPLGIPILPPEQMVAYTQRLGIAKATQTNRGEQIELPQDYADMLGWRDMAAAVAAVVETMPHSERAEMVVVGNNYGEAGALEFYGPRFHLPPVINAKGSFWFFGPGDRPGRIVVTLGEKHESLQRIYRDVQDAGYFDAKWLVPEEHNLPILIGRNPSMTLQQLWPSLAGRN